MPGGYDPMQMMMDMILRSPDGEGSNRGVNPVPTPVSSAPQMKLAPQQSPVGLGQIMQILMMLMQQRNTPGTERYNSPLNPAFANRPLP